MAIQNIISQKVAFMWNTPHKFLTNVKEKFIKFL